MTPKEAAKLTILDPACGSGSFLLGAYQYLLDWHLKWYSDNDPKKWSAGKNPPIYIGPGGDWRLTAAKKKEILLNNIHGVDIDAQAVEVTKLSLLLQVLEGESAETINAQRRLFHDRALPDLSRNIKCGNSLIGWDFFSGQLSPDPELVRQINPFDWDKEFPEIFKKNGGFDAVIGNPPYIPIELLTAEETTYFTKRFDQLERKYDSSILFILIGIGKLNPSGLLGYISSVTWQTGENYSKLRSFILETAGIRAVVNLPFDVFKDAYVDTGVYILSKAASKSYKIFQFDKKSKISNLDDLAYKLVPVSLISEPENKLVLNPSAQLLLKRITSTRAIANFGEITSSTQGLAGNRFKLKPTKQSNSWYKFLSKGQAHRFILKVDESVYADMDEHPSLKRFYEANPKLLIRRVISRDDRILAAYCNEQMVFKKDINPFIVTAQEFNPLYLLGIINSKLISYLYINTSSIALKDDFRQTTLAELRRLPIPKVESKKQQIIADPVSHLISLRSKIEATSQTGMQIAQRQIEAADRQIDALVYELYGLTKEEIKIVEN